MNLPHVAGCASNESRFREDSPEARSRTRRVFVSSGGVRRRGLDQGAG
jgi:hypothetical protein